jgi:ABC-type glycerol-3-phosphate transport system permease component
MIDPMGKRIGTLIVLIIFAIYAMIPIILVVFTSFKTSQELFENVIAPPTQMMWENYIRVWELAGFKNYFMNSVVIALPTVLCVVIFSTLSGYAFAKMNFPGTNNGINR